MPAISISGLAHFRLGDPDPDPLLNSEISVIFRVKLVPTKYKKLTQYGTEKTAEVHETVDIKHSELLTTFPVSANCWLRSVMYTKNYFLFQRKLSPTSLPKMVCLPSRCLQDL
jgi:hypothetical protein